MLVPSTRDQCILIADTQKEDLTPDQIAGFRVLFRLDDPRSIGELVAAGEVSPLEDQDVVDFIKNLKTWGISNRADFDNTRTFLKLIVPSQKDQIRRILPDVVRSAYFLEQLLRALDGDR